MTIAQTLRVKWHAFLYYLGDQPLSWALLRWGMWGIRCLLRLPAVVDIPRFGIRLYLTPRWRGCWKAIFVFRERVFEISDPEIEFVRRSLKPGNVFIDAGAYHGWYALAASQVVGDAGHVLAFEPNPDAYAILMQNVSLNDRRNLRAFNVALSDADETVWLYRGPGDEASSALARVSGGVGRDRVAAKRLDDLLADLRIARVDAMKIDVQGAEARVFRGAMKMLRALRPLLVFEVDPVAASGMGVSTREAWDILAGLGYGFFRVASAGLEPLREFPTVPEGTFLNVVAIPDSYKSERPSIAAEGRVSTGPLVSVVMPVYNAADTVEEAVRSLLVQTYGHLEILVVDDGSTDASVAIVAGIQDPRIKLLQHDHQGLVKTLNYGCAQAQGEYIARLDADDVAHERRMAAQVTYLEGHAEMGLLGTWANIVSAEGEEGIFEPPVADPALRRYLLWDNPFVHSSVMFRREAFRRAGGYPEGLAEEYRLWIRMARSWKIAMLPEVLVTHRIHRASYTRRQRRAAALRGRFKAQWEAAGTLGPWHQALPALGVTVGAMTLALVGGRVESSLRRVAGHVSGRLRGFRHASRGHGS